MEALHNAIFPLLVAWGGVTALLILVLIYRSMLGNREEDQIFLDAAAQSMANDQRAIVARIEKLNRPITALMVVSGVLLMAVAGLWIWQSFQAF